MTGSEVYTITRTVGVTPVWFTRGGKWSPEWPDAWKFRTRSVAEKAAKQIRAAHSWFADAKVEETDVSESWSN